ncbi:hypothetical protein [Methylovulum psychrotolerans]|uniref:Uncharacterized protein n=1 Tax=Methylovulum psychrotolerans TaxID=1704499 RepID=A0A1Z4C295_9GAMM|nr:hypothetical protein [Methylovulum psychrotolerans]ASF47644.1 hypothetical protein CEK71_17105 [Methylovulum psychrotolerans]
MFDKKKREKLDRLAARLISWMDAIPTALEFQHQAKGLLDELDTVRRRSSWYNIISEDSVIALTQRCNNLENLAIGLRDIVGDAQPLVAELNFLRELFKKEEGEAFEYGKQICEQWHNDLLSVSLCSREVDIFPAKQRLRLIESELRLHAEALRKFQNADDILSKFSSNLETAILENQLRIQRAAMLQSQLSADGINQIKTLCAPLEELSKRPEPPEIRMMSETLAEIRRWTRAFELPSKEDEQLDRRFRQLETDWRLRDVSELADLCADAEALKTSRIQYGHNERTAKLTKLQDALTDLMMACGPQPESESSLKELKNLRVDRARDHLTWLEAFKTAKKEFNAIANTYELALDNRLDTLCSEWGTGLASLQAQPLAQSLRLQAETLQQRLDGLNGHKATQDLLLSLREAKQGLVELDNLKRQADADREGFDRAKQKLRLDNDRLQKQAAIVGIVWENLQAAIDTLGGNASNPDLDEVLAETHALEQRLTQLCGDFIRDCHNQLACNSANNQRLYNALLQAGYPDAAEGQRADAFPNDAEQCANQIAEQLQQHSRLEHAIDEAIADMQQRCKEEQRLLLGLLDRQTLESDYFERMELLLGQLDSPIGSYLGYERLNGFAERFKACQAFWRDLYEEEEKLRNRLDKLKYKLGLFNQERLKKHCSLELFEMVNDWVRGLPEQPRQIHIGQLSEAEMMLERLEQVARHRVAEEVRKNIALLKQNQYNRPEVIALLGKIEDFGQAIHLPYDYRRQLDSAVTALGGYGHD